MQYICLRPCEELTLSLMKSQAVSLSVFKVSWEALMVTVSLTSPCCRLKLMSAPVISIADLSSNRTSHP